MLDHLALQCADVDAAADFYLRVFAPCGVREAMRFDTPEGTVVGLSGPGRLPEALVRADGGPGDRPVHLALTAPSREAVDEVFARGPGRRAPRSCTSRGQQPEYHPGYYGVFFRDPDGNNVEAVHHGFPA